MCTKCRAYEVEVADLEQHAADLIENIHYLEDGILDLLHIDDRILAQLLAKGAGARFIPYVPFGSPLDEQRVQGADETRRLLTV